MSQLTDSEAAIAAALERIGRKSRYAEVVAQRTRGLQLRHDRTSTTVEPVPRLLGAVFRAWTGAAWLEAASSRLDRRSLSELVERMEPTGGGGAGATDPPGPLPTGRASKRMRPRRPVPSSVEPLREAARRLYDWAGAVKGIDNPIIAIGTSEDERIFLSTSGARRHQVIPRTFGAVSPLAVENGRADYDFLTHGGTGGLEVLDFFTEEKVRDTARRSLEVLHARTPPSGRTAVVLDPSTAGTFAHESFGHGTEADQILRKRSYLAPLLGKQLGPECITLVDDGSYPGASGTLFYDDEGTPTQRTVLVDHGRFVEVLHDRESAAALHRSPTGNARRADFLSRSFVRMTNTFVEPGDWSLEELLEEAKNGILLESCTSGIEDPLGGNMQIKVKKGRLIENGRLTTTVSSMALSGKVLDFLSAIRGVGKADQFENSPGFCGKGTTDLLPVSSGGPFLLSEAVVGPA